MKLSFIKHSIPPKIASPAEITPSPVSGPKRKEILKHPRANQPKRGVVLLIVVVMLAVVCIMLTQLATLSFSRIRDVGDSQRELQGRWALVSLRRSCLPRAASLLGNVSQWQALDSIDSERKAVAPITRIAFTVEINNRHHEVKLGDESAKLCVPSFARLRENDTLSSANRLLQRTGARIREDAFRTAQTGKYRWHDILDLRLIGNTRLPIDEIGAQVTIFGDGQLNVFRAEDEVLQAAWRIAFGQFPPSAVREAREVYPPRPWREFRESLGMRDDDLRTLDQHFSGDSDCFSLTIKRHTGGQMPKQCWMFVSDRNSRHHGLEF